MKIKSKKIIPTLLFLVLLGNMGIIAASAAITKVEIIAYPPVINKGATSTLSVIVTPEAAISGMQGYPVPNYNYLAAVNTTEGNLFNRESSTFFSFGSNEWGSYVFAVVLGPYSYDTTGLFTNTTMIGVKNGSVNISMYNTIIANPEGVAVDFEVYTTKMVITQSCDINGDLLCNLLDSTILNQYWNKTAAACPQFYGRCVIKGYGSVNIIDKTILQQGYNKPIIKGQ